MEAVTSAALLELAAPDAGAAAKSTAAVALPAALRKRERPTDWDPDRPLEKWQVGVIGAHSGGAPTPQHHLSCSRVRDFAAAAKL